MTTPASAAITAQIVEMRGRGLSWAQIATRTGLTRTAVRGRYVRETELSERQRRKHAEALVEQLRGEVARLKDRIRELEARSQ